METSRPGSVEDHGVLVFVHAAWLRSPCAICGVSESLATESDYLSFSCVSCPAHATVCSFRTCVPWWRPKQRAFSPRSTVRPVLCMPCQPPHRQSRTVDSRAAFWKNSSQLLRLLPRRVRQDCVATARDSMDTSIALIGGGKRTLSAQLVDINTDLRVHQPQRHRRAAIPISSDLLGLSNLSDGVRHASFPL